MISNLAYIHPDAKLGATVRTIFLTIPRAKRTG